MAIARRTLEMSAKTFAEIAAKAAEQMRESVARFEAITAAAEKRLMDEARQWEQRQLEEWQQMHDETK